MHRDAQGHQPGGLKLPLKQPSTESAGPCIDTTYALRSREVIEMTPHLTFAFTFVFEHLSGTGPSIEISFSFVLFLTAYRIRFPRF
ncbi:hypothetical protein BDW66DRAFT_135043 [Aspergillus desertorum]